METTTSPHPAKNKKYAACVDRTHDLQINCDRISSVWRSPNWAKAATEPTARVELAIFWLEVKRVNHYATQAAYMFLILCDIHTIIYEICYHVKVETIYTFGGLEGSSFFVIVMNVTLFLTNLLHLIEPIHY